LSSVSIVVKENILILKEYNMSKKQNVEKKYKLKANKNWDQQNTLEGTIQDKVKYWRV
jgi:hypothetical protein